MIKKFLFSILPTILEALPFDKIIEIVGPYLNLTIPNSPHSDSITIGLPTLIDVTTHTSPENISMENAAIGFKKIPISFDLGDRYTREISGNHTIIRNYNGLVIGYWENTNYRIFLNYSMPLVGIFVYYFGVFLFLVITLFLPGKYFFRLTSMVVDSLDLDSIQTSGRSLSGGNVWIFIWKGIKFSFYIGILATVLGFYIAFLPPIFQDYKYLSGNMLILLIEKIAFFDGLSIKTIDIFFYSIFLTGLSLEFTDKYFMKYGRLN